MGEQGRAPTAGEEADVEERLVLDVGGLVAEHGVGPPHPHASLLQPAHQPVQRAVTHKWVGAQVTVKREREREREGEGERGRKS